MAVQCTNHCESFIKNMVRSEAMDNTVDFLSAARIVPLFFIRRQWLVNRFDVEDSTSITLPSLLLSIF